ncbi:glycoside hydrolase family 6 protein [Kitasatospora sp. NPDC054939]
MLGCRTAVGAAVLALAVGAAGCSGGAVRDGSGGSGAGPAPTGARGSASAPAGPPAPQLKGQTFFVSERTNAAQQAVALRAQGRAAEADTLARIAAQPSSQWLGDDAAQGIASQVSWTATGAGRTPVFVAYNIPHRDCGLYSAGGAPDAAAYRAWISSLAAALGDRRAWVVLEPDAVPHTLDGCGVTDAAAAERYGLLAFAVQELKKRPQIKVYLDAGNPGWTRDRPALAEALRKAGVGVADGFSVNVANFYTTDQSAAYGSELSALLGGKPFVIDTSRNGNGPLSSEAWCNPPGRRLGETPTDRTGRPGVDAYLWIKNPGESDGDCGRGEPRAGTFWLPYALGLAGS